MRFVNTVGLFLAALVAQHCASPAAEGSATTSSALTIASRIANLRDVVGAGDGAMPVGFGSFGDRVLFFALSRTTPGKGEPSLFITDGTALGTTRLAALEAYDTKAPAVAGGLAYFVARPVGATVFHLMRTDGTAAGTRSLGALAPQSGVERDLEGNFGQLPLTTTPWGAAFCNDRALKLASGDAVRTIVASGSCGNVRVTAGGILATASTGGTARWNAASGVGDMAPFTMSSKASATGNVLFDISSNQIVRRNLESDEVRGTLLRAAAGSAPSEPLRLLAKGGYAYVIANDARHTVAQLWRTDGVTSEILTTFGGTGFMLVDAGDRVYAASADVLLETDGTATGTREIARPGVDYRRFHAHGNEFIYREDTRGPKKRTVRGVRSATGITLSTLEDLSIADSSSLGDTPAWSATGLVFSGPGRELWRFDGVSSSRVVDLNTVGEKSSKPSGFARVGDRVAFVADPAPGKHTAWATDGTERGTVPILEVTEGPGEHCRLGVLPNERERTQRLFFYVQIHDSSTPCAAAGLYGSDGTPAGTVRVAPLHVPIADMIATTGTRSDFFTGGKWVTWNGHDAPVVLASMAPPRWLLALSPASFVARTEDGTIWISDGTPDGTKPLPATRVPGEFRGATAAGGRAYFASYDAATERGRLYVLRGDGSLELLHERSAPSSWMRMQAVGDRLMLSTHDTLVFTDGTVAGTTTTAGRMSGDPVAYAGVSYFTDETGATVIATNGTAAGTARFTLPGPTKHVMPAVGGFFFSDDANISFFDEGTGMATRIATTGAFGARFKRLDDGTVTFLAADGERRNVIASSLGTPETTFLASVENAAAYRYSTLGQRVIFSAADAVGDVEPWVATFP